MKQLARAINAAFFKAYPQAVDILGDGVDEQILIKRVNMLLDDLLCTRINFHVTNEAYGDAMRQLRAVQPWWRFW